MRGCRQKDDVATGGLCYILHECMALLLHLIASICDGCAVRLINNHELGTIEQEKILISFGFKKIDTRDLNRIMLVDALGSRFPSLELAHCARSNYDCLKVELLRNFSLPLIA